MIRYRCPHCAAQTVAHERRAGQSSVCKACVKPHQIPADTSLWLNEAGELLYPPVAVDSVPVSASSTPELPPVDLPEVPKPRATTDELAATVPGVQFPEPPERTANHRELAATIADIEIPEPSDLAAHFDSLSPTIPDVQFPDPPELVPLEPVPSVAVVPEPEPQPKSVSNSVPSFGREVSSPRVSRKPLDTQHAAPVATSGARAAAQPERAALATLTPPPALVPRVNRPRARSGSAPGSESGPRRAPVSAASSEPMQLQTQADIAVALTAALTSRMKPPLAPRRDLRPSTAAWMLLTGFGVALLGVALFSETSYRWAALVVGAVQIAAGYGWIVRLTHMRDPVRGALCAVPPLTFVYLAQFKYAKFRPLRFIATGAAIVGLAALAPALAPHTQALFRGPEEPVVVPPDPATQSKLVQLRHYHEQRSYDPLCKVLDVLAKTDPLLSADAKDRAELAAELARLCQHADTGVKVRAMSAYARWDPEGARGVCVTAVLSPSAEERKRALELLPHWRDSGSARAVQSLIGRAGVETNQAKAALEEIGGAPAEQAAWALLHRADNQTIKLTALELLEKVGGPNSVIDLRNYALSSDDAPVRARASAAADAIDARVRASVPAP